MANKRSSSATSTKKIKPTVPDSIKSMLKEKADRLIDEVIKPQHVNPALTTNDYNYIADINSKWSRNYFYFCATYNCPGSNAMTPSFETQFARMEYVENNKFNLSYMKHTEKWFEVFQNLTMDDCLKLIEEDPTFLP